FGHWLDLHGVPPSACCQPLMLFVVFPPDQCITPEPLLRWAYLWVIVRRLPCCGLARFWEEGGCCSSPIHRGRRDQSGPYGICSSTVYSN
ncbi:MAG TPA: hypothetical protein VFB60_11650, partial [Ktedonobacteraceae bacterium]|nr:hypothetical protein [Ktedonobacteraceae bacterium]